MTKSKWQNKHIVTNETNKYNKNKMDSENNGILWYVCIIYLPINNRWIWDPVDLVVFGDKIALWKMALVKTPWAQALWLLLNQDLPFYALQRTIKIINNKMSIENDGMSSWVREWVKAWVSECGHEWVR